MIALMAKSSERVSANAKLVAQFERAKLILQWERRLGDLQQNRSFRARILRYLSGLPTGRGRFAAKHVFPNWIHVLAPSETTSDTDKKEPIVAALSTAHEAMLEEKFGKMAKAISTSHEETKRLATLVVETQEKHSNQLRELERQLAVLSGGAILNAKDIARRRSTCVRPLAASSSVLAEKRDSLVTEQASTSDSPLGWLGGMFTPPSQRGKRGSERVRVSRVSLSIPAEIAGNGPPVTPPRHEVGSPTKESSPGGSLSGGKPAQGSASGFLSC
jgi:hypothetical protein